MRDDPKKNLKRVEEELLSEMSQEEEFGDWLDEEEEETDWLEDTRELLADSAPRKQAFDYDAEEEDDSTVYAPSKKQVRAKTRAQKKAKKAKKEKGVGGLVFLACLETLGIVAVLLWWVIWLL